MKIQRNLVLLTANQVLNKSGHQRPLRGLDGFAADGGIRYGACEAKSVEIFDPLLRSRRRVSNARISGLCTIVWATEYGAERELLG